MGNEKYVIKVKGPVLVLGGTGGIGYEIVRALVANGARKVSFSYGKNKKAAEKLAAKLTKLGVKKVFYSSINQSDEKDVNRFLEAATDAMGEEIKIAVNAIGISPNKPLERQTLETRGDKFDDKGWREVFEVNVFGCFVSTRAIAERMGKKKVNGVITLITSTNGINSHSQISTHYDSSKASQSHMMRILAEHYSKKYGIRINGVAPGWVDTTMNDTLPASERKREMKKIWSKRFAKAHEVARFVAAVSGTGGENIFGQDIVSDGGYR